MNLALSDEQVFLREAARGALSRFKTIEAAREALDGNAPLPDLWPTAIQAGWPGLLIDEAHGGAGLDAFDAMLVLGECGRVLAGVPLLGHLPASAILNDSPNAASWLARGRKRRAASGLPARTTARRPRRSVEHGPGQRPGAWDPAHRRSARSGRSRVDQRELCVRARRSRGQRHGGGRAAGRPACRNRGPQRLPGRRGPTGEPLRRDQVAGARLVQRTRRPSSWTPPRIRSPAPGTSPRL